MDAKTIAVSVVSIAIACLFAVTLLIPVIAESTTTEDTFTNKGLYYMTNPTEQMTYEFLGGTDWTVNGEPLDYTLVGATNILIFDDIFIRNIGQVRGSVNSTWQSAEIVVDNGTVTGTAIVNGTSTSINWTYTESYVATNDNSDYIMKSNTAKSYIKTDTDVIGMGMSNIKDSDGNSNSTVFYVSVENLTPVVTTPNTYVTVSDVQLNVTPVDGYVDLYEFDSVTFKTKWGDYESSVMYNVVIVPSEVTAERSIHPDANTNALLNLIPLLVVVGIILGTVGFIALRK